MRAEQPPGRSRQAYPGVVSQFADTLESGPVRRAYWQVLATFGRWTAREGVDPLFAPPAAVTAFLAHRAGAGRAGQDRTALEAFFGFVVAQGLRPASPVVAVEDGSSAGAPPALDELLWVIDAAEAQDPTTHTVVLALVAGGFGLDELLSVDVEHLERSHGVALVRLPRRWGRRSVIPLTDRVEAAVLGCVAGRSTGALLVDPDGSRLTRSAATRIVSDVAGRAGVDGSLTPSDLERSFVELAVAAGVTGGALRSALGDVEHRLDQHRQHAVFAVEHHLAVRRAELDDR
ncbi:hypothetical protein GCM10009613_26870 [Pseudonocardia kongjuensis]|uniref:Tyr recombinase domain-containing protein n=1 Tax=Pseudonocardia kongjuensis TaxID=102227 RepID=A0ABP4IEN4_9PSEU